MYKQLNDYELSCGFVQEKLISSDQLFYVKVELYKEHDTFHIRAFKCIHNSSSCTRLSWDIEDNFNQAQNKFNSVCLEVDKH